VDTYRRSIRFFIIFTNSGYVCWVRIRPATRVSPNSIRPRPVPAPLSPRRVKSRRDDATRRPPFDARRPPAASLHSSETTSLLTAHLNTQQHECRLPTRGFLPVRLSADAQPARRPLLPPRGRAPAGPPPGSDSRRELGPSSARDEAEACAEERAAQTVAEMSRAGRGRWRTSSVHGVRPCIVQ
jgi:hypothetical protein